MGTTKCREAGHSKIKEQKERLFTKMKAQNMITTFQKLKDFKLNLKDLKDMVTRWKKGRTGNYMDSLAIWMHHTCVTLNDECFMVSFPEGQSILVCHTSVLEASFIL